MRVLSSAATVKVKMARSTSVRAALIGLPASCASVRENSSLRSVMVCATRRSTRCRSNAGNRRVVPNAFTAARMAASACWRVP